MIAAADTSFLVSLYGGDVHTPGARAWMAANATPVLFSDALRFETENALRLACFRGRITIAELQAALSEIESDLATGILIARDIPAAAHWSECCRLSGTHTLSLGCRAFDITHVAASVIMGADTFLSFDQKQRTLAFQAGLMVGP